MKKIFLVTALLSSLVLKAELTGKVSTHVKFPIEFRTNETLREQYEETNGKKKTTISLVKLVDPTIDSFRVTKAFEATGIDTKISLDLGWDNAPIIYGGEIGTQSWTHLPNNIPTLYAKNFLKFDGKTETGKYLANFYVGYKNEDILLKPQLKITYYLENKALPYFGSIKANTLDIYGSIYHEFDNGWRMNQSLDIDTSIKTAKENKKIQTKMYFNKAEYIVGASNFIANSLLFKGRVKVIYNNAFSVDERQRTDKVNLGVGYQKLLKPLVYEENGTDSLAKINSGKTSNKKYEGYSPTNSDFGIKNLYMPTVSAPQYSAYTNPQAPYRNAEVVSKMKYSYEIQPRFSFESYKNRNIRPAVQVETRLAQQRFYEKTKTRQFTDEEFKAVNAFIKSKNSSAKDLSSKGQDGVGIKDYVSTRLRTIIDPQFKYTGTPNLFLRGSLRTEFDYTNMKTEKSYFNNETRKYANDSSKYTVETVYINFQPSLELEYTADIKPGIKVNQIGLISYSLKTLAYGKGDFKNYNATTGEWVNKKGFSSDPKKEVDVYALKKDVDFSKLTYNEAKSVEKEKITTDLPAGIVNNELSIVSGTTFTFDVASGLTVDLGLLSKFNFGSSYYSMFRFNNIQVVPHLGLNYEF